MIDWTGGEQALLTGTSSAVREFFSSRGTNDLCAIGYVFEFGQPQASFDLCANTRGYYEALVAREPGGESDDLRWNSGNYEFPAGLMDPGRELGPDWDRFITRLHGLAKRGDDETLRKVYAGLIDICCHVLARLSREGLFGNPAKIDFNVSDVDDDVRTVQRRDRLIRKLIGRRPEE